MSHDHPRLALHWKLIRAACAAALMASAIPAEAQSQSPRPDRMQSMSQMEKALRDWPMASRDAAAFMMKKYGAPAATTSEMLIWGKTGPWKRTVIYRREYAHEFPMHHTDVMQQWIDYKAPAEMYDELAMYDGSVVVERTSGEISARCDKEGANFLALNLADEIVRKKRTVADARKMYGAQIMAMKAMKPAPYTERLLFGMMSGTGDADRPLTSDAATSSTP